MQKRSRSEFLMKRTLEKTDLWCKNDNLKWFCKLYNYAFVFLFILEKGSSTSLLWLIIFSSATECCWFLAEEVCRVQLKRKCLIVLSREQPLVLPPSLKENLLDFGVRSATDTSSIVFVVVNSNPIEVRRCFLHAKKIKLWVTLYGLTGLPPPPPPPPYTPRHKQRSCNYSPAHKSLLFCLCHHGQSCMSFKIPAFLWVLSP